MKPTRSKQRYEYTAVFEPDQDGGYTVTVPALPGCISEGDTFEEALKNISEAAKLYLAVMRERKEEHLLSNNSETIVTQIAINA